MMQTLRFRTVCRITKVKKSITRCVTVNSSTVAEDVKQTQNLKSWREIPGPSSLPFIGPGINFLPGGKLSGCKGVKLFQRLYELYGPIARLDGVFGSQDIVLLSDPVAVEYVFRSEEMTPVRPGIQSLVYYRQRHKKTYDPKRLTGLASDQGENWREFRSKVNPIMMQPKTIKLYTDVLEEVSNDMVTRLKSIRGDDDIIKKRFNVEMNLWALESIGVVALGARLNCFDPNLPASSPARKLIQNVHDIFDVAEKLDFGPSAWRLFPTPMFKKAMKIYEEHESLTKHFIDQAKRSLEETKTKTTETSNVEKPVLEKLLEIDVRVAHIMASDMLLAGVDTAANTAMATLYLLAKNQEKQKKLREEILTKPTRSYLKACIKESMRMLPVAIGNARMATKEYNLMDYKIPKDVLFVFPHQYMSNLEEQYPKPNEYIPERWLADKDDPLYHGNSHRFAMAPFGFGIRMCIGRRIAELEMETLIIKIVENFQID